MWYIETILKRRKRNGKQEVLIKWDGFPDKFNQWLPSDTICDAADA